MSGIEPIAAITAASALAGGGAQIASASKDQPALRPSSGGLPGFPNAQDPAQSAQLQALRFPGVTQFPQQQNPSLPIPSADQGQAQQSLLHILQFLGTRGGR